MRELTSDEMLWVSGGDSSDSSDDPGDGGGWDDGGDGDGGGGGGDGVGDVDYGGDYGTYNPSDYDSTDPTISDIFTLPDVTVVGDKGSTLSDVKDVLNDVAEGTNWADVFGGLGIIGGVITAIALAPAAVPILGVAGIAALGTELAGIGLTMVGTSGSHP